MKMVVKRSDKPNKKYMAVFTKDNGRTKTTHFGQRGATDYLLSKDKERRARYRQRHKKDLKTKDPTRAGFLSYYLLWGDSTSLRTNIQSYKRRFNLS
jgi:hypothetical protein